MERKEVEERLNKKIHFKIGGWLINDFYEFFESNHLFGKISKDNVLEIIKKFLNNQNMNEIIFFPDSSVGWGSYDPQIKKSNDPVSFKTVEEAVKFLKDQIIYGADNYYITNNKITWVLTICHEEDFQVLGDESFVEEFKELYLH